MNSLRECALSIKRYALCLFLQKHGLFFDNIAQPFAGAGTQTRFIL
jgi:hypothetical protein